MKNEHGVFFGFAVLLVTVIFMLAGCDTGTGSSVDDSPKELVITGISGVSANMIVAMLTPDLTNDSNMAAAGANSNGGSVTIQLTNLTE
jgi:hypothetical protein